MDSVLKEETTTVQLTLNATDVEDFLAALRYLRFPIAIDFPKLNGKKISPQTTIGNGQSVMSEEEQIWEENQAKGQALMLEMAKIDADSEPELSENDMMELINAEIKAYRAEKRAALEQNH